MQINNRFTPPSLEQSLQMSIKDNIKELAQLSKSPQSKDSPYANVLDSLTTLQMMMAARMNMKLPLDQRPIEKTSDKGLKLEDMHTTRPENFDKPMGKDKKIHSGAWFHGSSAEKTGMDHMFHLDDNGKTKNKYFHFTKGSISGKDGAPNVNLHGSKNGDGKAMSNLFEGKKEAKYLNDEQLVGLRRRMTESRGENALDASDTMKQIGKIGKKYGKDSKEMSNFLQKIGAEQQDPARKAQIEKENQDLKVKHNGIKGLNENVDLSVFESYKIEGKTADGKKVKFEVSKEQAASAEFLNGRLQGAVDKNGNPMDFSNLKDVKITGTLRAADDEDNGKTHRKVKDLSVDQLNKVFNSESPHEAFAEFRPKRKNFFQKVFGGIKDVVTGIGKGIASIGAGIVNGVKDVVVGGAKAIAGTVSGVFTGDFDKIKQGFKDGWTGIKEGFNSAASGIEKGLGQSMHGLQSGITQGTGAFLGDTIGGALGDAAGKFGNFVKDLATDITNGVSTAVSGYANIMTGEDSLWDNIKKIASGGFDAVTGVVGGKGAIKGLQGAAALIKGGADDAAKLAALKLAIKVSQSPSTVEQPKTETQPTKDTNNLSY